MYKKNDIVDLGDIDYTLKEQKGSGGSSVVWLVEASGQKYAIKFITSDSQSKKARFEREIAFCRNATHGNIIKLIADGQHRGTLCYVMPYYSKTLRDVISEEKNADKLIKYIFSICKAVKYIHRKGIKHRDIKPENILIDGAKLVLADFGIAHFKNFGLTKDSEWLANRNYMAPEQRIKNNANSIGQAADVYALGLIINECFTKQNPAGSNFELISSHYPLLSELDSLVDNMIRQKPEDRFSIDNVEAELKFIYAKLKQSLDKVHLNLSEEGYPRYIPKSVLNKIFKKASEDILFGKYLFAIKDVAEINKYNKNWHMRIGYSVDYLLFNLYVQERIFAICKSKFEYESNVYRKDSWRRTLDLRDNLEDKSLYEQMSILLAKYNLSNHGWSLLDLSGAILKYFSCCTNYHCKEILLAAIEVEKSAEYNLNSAPIIWIVSALRRSINENIDILLNGHNGLSGRFEFNFAEHILINWDRAQDFITNDDDDELFDSCYLENEKEIEKILTAFHKKWKVKIKRLDNNYYSVKFTTYRMYQKFRNYTLQLAQPYYIFEGDVLHILSNPNFVEGMVELKLGKIFDIPNTIAQIVGLKEIGA
uniref:Serine/threonine protein kinase n=1 Tax=Sphingobacterium sp. (strain 21) TaxID=743722 RepID=F4C9R3_SPHS2